MLSRVWITSLSGSPRWMLSPNLFNSLLGNMLSKRRLKMAVAIAILTGLFWYVVTPILNQQMVYSHYSRNAPAEDKGNVIVTIWHNDTPTTSHTRHATHAPATPKVVSRDYLPDVLNLTISDAFMKSIPQNGAYWNRLFHTILKGMAEGENKIRNQSWPRCRESSHEVLLTNVHDFNAYTEVAKDFVRGMDCKSPPILIDQPNKCRSGDGKTFLLFAIKSSPANFVRRQTVRETWGKEGVYEGGLRVRTVFLLGSSATLDDPDLRQLLAFEARVFGDMLQWDFHDSLFNLALKQHMFFKWTQKNCPRVSFVFDGDDDVFVHTRQILEHVKSLDPTQASRAYIGQVLRNAWPIRDPKSKYYVPVSFYDGPYLPYAGGGGFLFSGALLEPLYNVSYAIPFFPIDDVFIGMCFSAIGVTGVQHNAFRTFDIRVEDRENICVHQDLLLVHQRSPQQIKKLWRGINNPDLRC